jgi:hypothetical protein
MRFAAVVPPGYDLLPGDLINEHPLRVWTWDDVIQVGTAEDWDFLPHTGMIQVPDSLPGAPVTRPGADDHLHRGEWWRQSDVAVDLYLGRIGPTSVMHAPDDDDHALVVDVMSAWASATLWVPLPHLHLVRVPPGTPGIRVAQYNEIVAPTLEITEDLELS